MIRGLDSASETFIRNLAQVSDRAERAQRQLSTGLRITRISDEPDQVSTILQARAELESVVQIQDNLGRVKAESDAAEEALQSAVKLLERARVLGLQGLSGTGNADTRKALADEVGAILEQIVGITATTVEGRHVFSGDADQQAPYSVDLTQPDPVSAYAGAGVTRLVQHPNGSRFGVAHTAQQIFDSPVDGENVFTALADLRARLLADDTEGISSALNDVGTALDHLNRELAYYGTVQNKVGEATEFSAKLQMRLKTHLGSLQDADLTEAILEMSQAQVQQQAMFKAKASMPRTTLFDYLG